MSTTYFNRPATHQLNQFARINDAYTLAGLTPPTYVEELKRTITNAPTVQQEAANIAREALEADDPAEFYEHALTRIQRAQAADVLKNAFAKNIQSALDSKAHHYRAAAANELAPQIAKLTKALATAAKKLPAGHPLDMAANIEAGTGTEYKTTRDTLAVLGTYAAIYPQGTPTDGIPTAIHAVLPIIELPKATIERIKPGLNDLAPVPSNAPQLTGTHTIRRIANDLALNMDDTLARIAAGHYDGATISFANPTELNARRANAQNAFKRTTDKHDTANSMVAI